MCKTICNILKQPCLLSIASVYLKLCHRLSCCIMPIVALAMRLWMGQIFWFSGLTKLQDWDNAISLFENIYNVPLLSPALAACMATTFELLCPIALLFGVATRLAVLPMLGMTAVIQFFVLPAQYNLHTLWALVLFALLCYGPGAISLDHLLKRFYQKASSLDKKSLETI